MAISAFLLVILEQAKEPLHCLHGAGYFTPEEWIQLDLIMNKEYSWTKGPPDRFIQKSIDRATHLKNENSSFFAENCKNAPNLHDISLYASVEPPISDINISPGSVEALWKLPIRTINGKSSESPLPSKSDFIPSIYGRDQRQKSSYTSILGEESQGLSMHSNESIVGYPLSTVSLDSKSPLSSSARKMKSISAWTSEVPNNVTSQISGIHPNMQDPSISSQLKKRSPRSPRSYFTEDQLKELKSDVNIFERSNAVGWDDNVTRNLNKGDQTKKIDQSTLVDRKNGKIKNYVSQEVQNKKLRQQASSTSNFSSRLATHSSNRVVDIPRLNRHRESRGRKNSKDNDTATSKKTRVCWFWAESPGGCRYKQEECLNLHVRPTLNSISRNTYGDQKSARTTGNGNNIVKPPTCWSWALTGTCSKGDKCKDVHSWLFGGAPLSPKKNLVSQKNLDKEAMEYERKEVTKAAGARTEATTNQNKQETNVMELVDLRSNEYDTDGRNPSQLSVLLSLDPTLNSSIQV